MHTLRLLMTRSLQKTRSSTPSLPHSSPSKSKQRIKWC
eukprot:UN08356